MRRLDTNDYFQEWHGYIDPLRHADTLLERPGKHTRAELERALQLVADELRDMRHHHL